MYHEPSVKTLPSLNGHRHQSHDWFDFDSARAMMLLLPRKLSALNRQCSVSFLPRSASAVFDVQRRLLLRRLAQLPLLAQRQRHSRPGSMARGKL